MPTIDELPKCPVTTTVRLVGNKWKLLIVRTLLEHPYRFNELRRDMGGISQKVLTENLRTLEADGIVRRIDYGEVPPRVEYRLTDLGEAMRPLIAEMARWGALYQQTACKSQQS